MDLTEREARNFDRLPERVKPIAGRLLKLQLEAIPEHPETNRWYRYNPPGYLCADGEPYHGMFKIGKENKLLILFCGGGVSIDDFTAARPSSIFTDSQAETFYFNDVFLIGDYFVRIGLPEVREDNPFRDWSMIVVPYATGDFHAGRNDHAFHDAELGDGIVHHHGHINLHMLLDGIRKYVRNPEKLLVTGLSAGGFATALLTDDIMDAFPDCRDVTAVVDSALLLFDGWRATAEHQWGAPRAIFERLVSDNLVQDSLLALHAKRPGAKIMFISSTRDCALAQYQSYIERKKMVATAADGEKYFSRLQTMCADLQEHIPDIGFYIFDTTMPELDNLTLHTLILDPNSYSLRVEGKTVFEWMIAGANGKTEKIGMGLLHP